MANPELIDLDIDLPVDMKEFMRTIEYNLLLKALHTANGVQQDAANLLGLNRTTLVEKMRKYGLIGVVASPYGRHS